MTWTAEPLLLDSCDYLCIPCGFVLVWLVLFSFVCLIFFPFISSSQAFLLALFLVSPLSCRQREGELAAVWCLAAGQGQHTIVM